MRHVTDTLWSMAALGTLIVLLTGCAQSRPAAPVQTTADEQADHTGHQHEDSSEIGEALAALSAEDRALAEAQKTCPVSDEPLGSMGTPQKLEVNGKTVFICCDGCAESLQNEPEKYLAKLSQ